MRAPQEKYMLKVAIDSDEFPGSIQVDENGIRIFYEPTGWAYVQDSRAFVEYVVREISMLPPEKKRN